MTVDESINRGVNAERLLADPLFSEAFEVLESEFVNDWKTSGVDEKDARERTFLKLSVLKEIKSKFSAFITDGHISTMRLKRKIL